MSKDGLALGIDVGGSGIKGAPVDLERGEFAADRLRIDTPDEATPEAVCDVIAEIENDADATVDRLVHTIAGGEPA